MGTDLPGVADQIESFAELYGPSADPDALYVVWAGTNDFFLPFDDPSAVINQALTNIISHVGSLDSLGAQHVAVLNLPNLGATPFASSAPGLSEQFSAITTAFNAGLSDSLNASGLPVTEIDLFARFEEIVSDPDAFGLTNVTVPSFDGSSIVADPSTSLFWDSVHPTARGHQLIADLVFEQLSDEASVTIEVAGVTTVPSVQAENRSGETPGELLLSLSADDAADNDRAATFDYTVDWRDGQKKGTGVNNAN